MVADACCLVATTCSFELGLLTGQDSASVHAFVKALTKLESEHGDGYYLIYW